jgi:hypothetical protein
MVRFTIRKIIGFIIMAIAGLFIFTAIIMLLWNNLLPTLFHLPVINMWQALGLLVLSKILFGGFHGGWRNGRPWKHRMQQKWMDMTPEQREKFKQEWGNRCGRRFQEEKPASNPAN